MSLSTETKEEVSSIDVTLAQLKRCIEDGDHQDSCKWAGVLSNLANDLRREIMASWESRDTDPCWNADEAQAWNERVGAARSWA